MTEQAGATDSNIGTERKADKISVGAAARGGGRKKGRVLLGWRAPLRSADESGG